MLTPAYQGDWRGLVCTKDLTRGMVSPRLQLTQPIPPQARTTFGWADLSYPLLRL